MKKTKQPKRIAFDIETTGLHPWAEDARVLLLTFCDEKGKITRMKGSERKKIEKMRAVCEDKNVVKIIQNASFDCTWLALHYGIYIVNIFDTKLAEQVIVGRGEYGDSSLVTSLAKYNIATLDKTITKTFIAMKDEHFTEEQLKYADEDVLHLHRLMDVQMDIIRDHEDELLMQLENLTCEVTYHMRLNGIAFDTDIWTALADYYHDQFDVLAFKLDDHFNNVKKKYSKKQNHLFESNDIVEERRVSWTSPAQVKKHFEEFKINDFDQLDTLRGKDYWLDIFIDLWNINKYVTTYGYKWLEVTWGKKPNTQLCNTVAADGRIHCDFKQIVSTGRFSSSSPNLQNIPGPTRHREAFIAQKGNVFVSGDFSGQEIAIMAFGSQEKSWLDAIKEGKDIHSIMASKFFAAEWKAGKEKSCTFPKVCSCTAHKKIRKKAKAFNFGLPYGKTAKTIALDLSMEIEDAQSIIDQYEYETPALNKWLKANAREAVRDYETYTLPPFKRYRNLHHSKEEWHRRNQGYNTPVQGTGGDMLKLALIYVYEASKKFKTAKVILCVHDEIISEVSKRESVAWAKVFKAEMKRAADFITEKDLVDVDVKIKTAWKLEEAE